VIPAKISSLNVVSPLLLQVVLLNNVRHPERGEGSAFKALIPADRKADSSLRSE